MLARGALALEHDSRTPRAATAKSFGLRCFSPRLRFALVVGAARHRRRRGGAATSVPSSDAARPDLRRGAEGTRRCALLALSPEFGPEPRSGARDHVLRGDDQERDRGQINQLGGSTRGPTAPGERVAQGAHVPEESDKRKAVFRTTPRTIETRPLWHGATFPFRVQYQAGQTNQGLRASNVRATAYLGGKLVAEQIKGVDELSAYFVPAVVARREALAGLLMHANQVGAEVGKATPPPSSGGSPVVRLPQSPPGRQQG